MPSKQAASPPISKRWISFLRPIWILVLATSIALSAIGWSVTYHRTLGDCVSEICEQALQLEDVEQLIPAYQALGLSLHASIILQITIEALAMFPYFLVGYILFSRRFDEKVGLLGAFAFPAFAAIALGPGSLVVPAPSLVGVLARIVAIIGQSSFVIFFLIFPDGRFVPRWTLWVGVFWTAMFVAFAPFGINPLDYIGLGFFLFLLVIIGAQIYRYRNVSSPVEKQQTKWVVGGLVFAIGGFVLVLGSLSILGPDWEQRQFGLVTIFVDLLIYLFLSSIPIFIGIAILRNRLWDIEVVVNRALIYGPLSAILAGVFAASVALINNAAREIFGTAATTSAAVVSALFIATIFQPLKTRIEGWVNKRFYPDNLNFNKEFVEFTPEIRSVIGLKDLLAVVTQKTTNLAKTEHSAVLLGKAGGIFRRTAAAPKSSGAAKFNPDKKTAEELQKGRAVSKGQQLGLWVPIYLRRLHKNDVLGVLDIGPHKNKTGFSSDDKKALSLLGAEIGMSIYAARLREKRNS